MKTAIKIEAVALRLIIGFSWVWTPGIPAIFLFDGAG
jgi:hypothetical protein